MPGPLDGVRVIELGSMYAAPTTGRLLRDFGADVIKIEDPAAGDYARQWQPAYEGQSIGFARLNSGKRSVGVDLRSPRGRDVVRRLAAGADVVVENFRPGRLEAWGLGYDALSADNPRLVLTRVSGFGQTGPYRERPGFGTIAEVTAGTRSSTGGRTRRRPRRRSASPTPSPGSPPRSAPAWPSSGAGCPARARSSTSRCTSR